MSTTERDPRVDPRPGDVILEVVATGYVLIRKVIDRFCESGAVAYFRNDYPFADTATIEGWRHLSRNATILKRAEESS